MNNAVAYIAPKNKMMENITGVNNRISCVVGISIFVFKRYWQRFINFMEIKTTTTTFKQFLQAETFNTEKNKSYYQQYDFKRLRAFHKQSMIKQQIY